MASYVELVVLGDNDKCRKVLALMGWETKEDQDELLKELSEYVDGKHYLVCYENTISRKPKIAEYDDFDILYTIGSGDGVNSWYPIEMSGFRDVEGKCWANEQHVDEECC